VKDRGGQFDIGGSLMVMNPLWLLINGWLSEKMTSAGRDYCRGGRLSSY